MADGYEPTFLGEELPLPRPAQETRGLTYPRFTVLVDPARQLAAVTAVNIDGASLKDMPRTGQWKLDPRIPEDEQAGHEVYSRNDLDRGHLVRRRDPGWGDMDEAREATEATFFYTNAAPQAAGFNQSKELWLGLEDHVLEYAENTDQRLSVFTAPVLGDDDPPYRGIRIPLRYWKVASWQSPEGLRAAGFLLDQSELVDVRQGLVAVSPLGAYRTFQVPISDIAKESGVNFGVLTEADVVIHQSARPAVRRELEMRDDIVL